MTTATILDRTTDTTADIDLDTRCVRVRYEIDPDGETVQWSRDHDETIPTAVLPDNLECWEYDDHGREQRSMLTEEEAAAIVAVLTDAIRRDEIDSERWTGRRLEILRRHTT